MWGYYLLIILSVVMFGGGFALQDVYRNQRGSSFGVSMEATCIGAFSGLIVLMIINGFSFEFTGFTFLMAFLTAVNGMAFIFCSFKSLDYINLSLFSLFAMLGGMLLPFLQGIVFYNEGITVAKIVCVLFVCAALLCTVEKGEKTRGTLFYVGIFLFNGMSGVLSKLFTESDLPKTSVAGYNMWIACITVLLSGAVWGVYLLANKGAVTAVKSVERAKRGVPCAVSYGIGALNGAINKVANFLLVFSLVYVDASVQYPLVTGGTMIVSTLLCLFGDRRPTKRELWSVALAFLGMLALFLIPV